MSDVKYSRDALSKPYDPSCFQRSSVPVPLHPYGQPLVPRAPYQQPWIASHSKHQAQCRGYQNHHQNQPKSRNNLEIRNAPLDPIHMSYNQLLQPLIQSSLVDPKPLNPFPQPYPPGYDPDVQCGYHVDSIGP